MPNETLARRYATAVFDLARQANAVADVGRDLHAFVAALAADAEVDRFFRSPVIDRTQKSDVISAAFAGLHELALHTVLLLIRKRRETLTAEIVRQYDRHEREARGAQTLRVTSARALSSSEIDGIVARLSQIYSTPFDVTQMVDANLIGGIRLTMGDTRIDGTIAGRLDDLARLLSTN
jgi:F-type H+-transporting ATPase subunit delta